MSLIEKIGLTDILSKIGLSEEQFRGCFEGEIKKLSDQEQTILKSIENLSRKSEEAFKKLQSSNQDFERVRSETEASKKDLQAKRDEFNRIMIEVQKKESDILILRSKLNEDKDAFAKERAIFRGRQEDFEKQEEALKKERLEVSALKKELENTIELNTLEIKRNHELLRKTEIDKEEFEKQKSDFAVRDAELNKKLSEIDLLRENSLRNLKIREDQLKIKTEDLQKEYDRNVTEFSAQEESLRKRELEIVRKEKEIKKGEANLKAKKEQQEILEGKK